ncbi:MAG: asparaginase [Nostocoides sp.]
MSHVVVVTTGGTIAARADARGDLLAHDSGAELLDRSALPGVTTEVIDLFRTGSNLMTFAMAHDLAVRVAAHAARPEVDGIVVTHGTDTLEETAFLLQLCVGPATPVIVTGAQRAADQLGADGPRNLHDAVTAAAHPASRHRGTMVAFDGCLYPAWGVRKMDTTSIHGFDAPGHGQIGFVRDSTVVYQRPSENLPRVDPGTIVPARARVDIVATYPGSDGAAIDALVSVGARGLVIEGMGAGNTSAGVAAAASEAIASGVLVMLASRVPFGQVAAAYGGDGGGADLVRAGAIPTGLLKAPQARMLLAALLGTSDAPEDVRDLLLDRFRVFLT